MMPASQAATTYAPICGRTATSAAAPISTIPTKSINVWAENGNPAVMYYSKRKGNQLRVRNRRDIPQYLERLETFRRAGAGYLVTTTRDRWFSRDLQPFWAEMRARYPLVSDDPEYLIFDLRAGR